MSENERLRCEVGKLSMQLEEAQAELKSLREEALAEILNAIRLRQ